MRNNSRQNAFTIVELLIVIVVIAILATISIVAYSGIQDRAKDAKIRAAVANFETGVRRFNIETGNQPWSGSQSTGVVTNNTCPGSTVASGWAGRTSYLCTIDDLLAAGGFTPATMFTSLPPNASYPSNNRTLMFYQCGAVALNKYVLYYYLINPSSEDSDSLADTTTECGHVLATFTGYGMRAGKIIRL
jgi:prepilin-type N-terminal cleavage/methylation domain-containing protein